MDADLLVNEIDSEEERDNEDEIMEDDDQTILDEIKKVTRYLTAPQNNCPSSTKNHKAYSINESICLPVMLTGLRRANYVCLQGQSFGIKINRSTY